MQHRYNLAIIGAGPAGIGAAVESYLNGIRDIIILEKDENHNSTIRKFYKENKRVDKDWQGQKVELDGRIFFVDGTKETTLDFFEEILQKHSVELQTHTEVQKIKKETEYFSIETAKGTIEAKYVVVTIGRMGKPNKPSYKIPSSIKKRVLYTLDGLDKDENILVVGGGDSAVEYALDLCETNDVSICYRRETFSRANPTNEKNINEALEQKKLNALLGINIDSLEDDNGKVQVNFSTGNSLTFDKVIF